MLFTGNSLQISQSNISKVAQNKSTKFDTLIDNDDSCVSSTHDTYGLIHSSGITQKTFLDTHAFISETTQHILTKFCMLIPTSLIIIVAEVYVNISKPFRNTRLSRKLLSWEWPSSLTLRTTVITCAALHFVLIRWLGIGHVWNLTIKWRSQGLYIVTQC